MTHWAAGVTAVAASTSAGATIAAVVYAVLGFRAQGQQIVDQRAQAAADLAAADARTERALDDARQQRVEQREEAERRETQQYRLRLSAEVVEAQAVAAAHLGSNVANVANVVDLFAAQQKAVTALLALPRKYLPLHRVVLGIAADTDPAASEWRQLTAVSRPLWLRQEGRLTLTALEAGEPPPELDEILAVMPEMPTGS